jgi:4-hydroxybenzoate polyprenyltransferase
MAKATQKTQDAPARHWTDFLPAPLPAFARLARLDRPIGWRLLLLPCLMGLALARTEEGFWLPDLSLAALFFVGAIAMRSAGCVYNDILDKDIDAKVARTRARPIPSGAVKLAAAWLFLAVLLAIGFVVFLGLPGDPLLGPLNLAQLVSLGAIPLVALYPLMKRITWWPQAWLGLTFSWGVLVAGAAVDDALDPSILLLYAGCVAWTIAYDTIYALQDVEDDALVGVRSTARLFGAGWRRWTLGFYLAAFFFWGAAAAVAGAGYFTIALLCALAGFLAWPIVDRVDPKKAHTALKSFKANAVLGLGVTLALALDPLARTFLPGAL